MIREEDMLYREFGKTREKVSALGFGCMRLPLIPGGDPSKIDERAAEELMHYSIDNGVNYIDTAYFYHATKMGLAGESEKFVGRILKNGYREKVKLATKLPSFLINTREDMDRYLNEQLERLQTDHIDFYLVHGIGSHVWPKLKELGIGEFMDGAIKDGRIKYAGFSFHDKLDLFKEIVDYYNWSFCQIQYNYLDEDFQAGTEGLKYASEKGLGVTIMEPLRGGKLANDLPKDVEDIFKKSGKGKTPAWWALRWVLNNPEVSVVLSGMNSMEQVVENIKVTNETLPGSLDKKEIDILEEAKKVFKSKIKVECTGCSYCMPCPNGVNIPQNFTSYNNYHMFGSDERYNMMSSEQRASNCIECGECEPHCPQGIQIPEQLKNVKEAFQSV